MVLIIQMEQRLKANLSLVMAERKRVFLIDRLFTFQMVFRHWPVRLSPPTQTYGSLFWQTVHVCMCRYVCVLTTSSARDRWDESRGLHIECLLSDWMFSQVWIWVPLRGNTAAAADGGLRVQQPAHRKVALMCRRCSHKPCAGLSPSLLQHVLQINKYSLYKIQCFFQFF